MIGEKRGFFIVVLLVILMSSFAFAGWTGHCPADQCTALVVGMSGCSFCDAVGAVGSDFVSCSDSANNAQCMSIEEGYSGDTQIPVTSDENCDFANYRTPGCWFVVGDDDGWDDDCGVINAAPGQKWGNENAMQRGNSDIIVLGDDIASPAESWLFDTLNIDDPWEYICTDTGYWARCDLDEHEGNKIVAEGVTYECFFNQITGAFEWTKD